MKNPVKEYREAINLPQNIFAHQCGVTAQAVMRTEQGLYTNIPVKIMNTLAFKTGDRASFIAAQYYAFQVATCKANYGCLVEPIPELPENTSPLIAWIIVSGIESRIELCKKLCLHPSPIALAEAGQQQIPTQMVDALLGSGYSKDTVTELIDRQKVYCDSKHRRVRSPKLH